MSDGADSSASDLESPSGSADAPTIDSDNPADNDAADVAEDAEAGGEDDEPTSAQGDEAIPPAAADEEAVPADEGTAFEDDSARDSASGDSAYQQKSGRSASAPTVALPDVSEDVDSTVTAARGSETFSLAAEGDAPATFSFAPATTEEHTAATTLTTTVLTPAAPQPRPTLVSVISDLVAAVLQPLLGPGNGSPIQIPILTAVLSLVRNEFERMLFPRATKVASQQTVSQLVDPTDQHVLVIGVDGTNLSRILADDENENFFELMDTSTTGPSSIVGHTTISNPSWTAILTGVWGERTGVINNVFTPWTYDRWPTVFNQLETHDPDIDTMAIANWNVINAIAAAGSNPVDENVFISQIEGDTNWLETDDAVGDATVAAISGTDVPNFLFSYFVGVDENGHLYGGASPQYRDAIRNMDDNLGEILDAVAAREASTGEDWTVIVVTDHGHQPQKGFGHGFQSPDETETFVIVDGPNFGDGLINPEYEIVDTAPTVVSLFGGTPRAGSDGVPLMTLSGSDYAPDDLHQALREEIAKNTYPDIVTNVALSLRTIFATVPYYVYTFGNEFSAGVPSFLVVPVQLLFSGLYVATNVPAQIVALATGVSGASIFPLLPPPPPEFGPTEEATPPDSVILVCAAPGSTPGLCGEPSVA